MSKTKQQQNEVLELGVGNQESDVTERAPHQSFLTTARGDAHGSQQNSTPQQLDHVPKLEVRQVDVRAACVCPYVRMQTNEDITAAGKVAC